jgi:IS30 family transposase
VSLPPLASVVREYWGHVSEGCTAAEAGVAVGVSRHTGVRWFRDAGGVKPRLIEPTTSGPRPRMCLQERIEIDFGVRSGESLQSIGRRLGRPASTIKREIDTNGLHNVHNRGRKSGYRRKEASGPARADAAQRCAIAR